MRQPFKLVLSLSFCLISCSLALAQGISESGGRRIRDFGVQLTKRLEGHTGPIYSIVYSPDHKRMVSAGGIFNAPGEFIIWDASAGAEKMRFNGHQGPVYGLTYAPDGTHFASAGSDGMIRVWDAETGTEIRSLDGHSGEAYCVLFSRDGSLLISGGGTQDQPGEVIIRNASTWENCDV